MQLPVRARVLRWFACAGHLDPADAREMASWDHGGGFSVCPWMLRSGTKALTAPAWSACCAILLGRPLRWSALSRCARMSIYRLPKPQADGSTQMRLTPLELIERLAALNPPPAHPPPPLSRHAGTSAPVQRQLLGNGTGLVNDRKWPNVRIGRHA